MEKPKIIVIVGPTASGKSGLGVDIAKKYSGEIISADSRQVYRKLDIGTAKITKEEMQGVSHHLIDVADIDTPYTAADFKRDASEIIEQIVTRGNLPIVVGGTFFYIDTLLGKTTPPEVPPNPQLRKKLEPLDARTLFGMLQREDSKRAEQIDPHNKRRIIRSLEIINTLGHVPPPSPKEPRYTTLSLGLDIAKDELRARMRTRATRWLASGFVDETLGLLSAGITRKRLAELGFEYQLCLALIDGELTKASFITQFEQKNWQYARKQLTWLKRDPNINWVLLSERREIDMLVKQFLSIA